MRDQIQIQNEIKNTVWVVSEPKQPAVEARQPSEAELKFLVQSDQGTGKPSNNDLSYSSQSLPYVFDEENQFVFRASAILPSFFVGGEGDFFSFQARFVQNFKKIQESQLPNIDDVLNVLVENRGLHINLVQHLSEYVTTNKKQRLDLITEDNAEDLENLKQHCKVAFSPIKVSFEKEESIFINCTQGQSRSVAVALYFLIDYFKVDALAAYYFVKSNRPQAGPIPAFFNFLYNEGKQYRPQRNLEFFRSWVEAKDTQENFFNRLKQVEIGSQKWKEPDQKQAQNQDGNYPKTWENLVLNDAFIGLMTLLECLGISDEQYYKVEFSKRSFNLTFHNEQLQRWFVNFFKDNHELTMGLIATSMGQIKEILEKEEPRNKIKNTVWMSDASEIDLKNEKEVGDAIKYLVTSNPETGAPTDTPLAPNYAPSCGYLFDEQGLFVSSASPILLGIHVGGEDDAYADQGRFVQQYQAIDASEMPNKEDQKKALVNRGLHINLANHLSPFHTTRNRIDLNTEQHPIDDNVRSLAQLKKACKDYFPIMKKSFENKERIYVNCQAGQSRSVTMVVYFLIHYYQIDALEAYYFVKSKRLNAGPIPAFFNFLYNEGKQYKPETRHAKVFDVWAKGDADHNLPGEFKQLKNNVEKESKIRGQRYAFIHLITLLDSLGVEDENYSVEFFDKDNFFTLTFHNEALQAWFLAFFKNNDHNLSRDLIETSIGQIKPIIDQIKAIKDLVSEINSPYADSEDISVKGKDIVAKAKKCVDQGASIPESVVLDALKRELERENSALFGEDKILQKNQYLLKLVGVITNLVKCVYSSGQSISEQTLISFFDQYTGDPKLSEPTFSLIIDHLFKAIDEVNAAPLSSQENKVSYPVIVEVINNNSNSYANFMRRIIKNRREQAALKILGQAITGGNEQAITEGCQRLINSNTRISPRLINEAIKGKLSKEIINQITDRVVKTNLQGLRENIFIGIITLLGKENYAFDEAFFTNLLGAVEKSRGGVTQESLKKAIELGQWPNVIAICKVLEVSGKPVDEQRFIDIVTTVAGSQKDKQYTEEAMLAVINAVANSNMSISEKALITILQLNGQDNSYGQLFARIGEIVSCKEITISSPELKSIIKQSPSQPSSFTTVPESPTSAALPQTKEEGDTVTQEKIIQPLKMPQDAKPYQILNVPQDANPYQILNVNQNASDKVIRMAYLLLAMTWHPDKYDVNKAEKKLDVEKPLAEEVFKFIGNAYAAIQNFDARQQYNSQNSSNVSQERPKYKENFTSLADLEEAIAWLDENAIIKGCKQLISAKIKIPEYTLIRALARDLSQRTINAIVEGVIETGEKVSETVLLFLIINTHQHSLYRLTCLPMLLDAIKKTGGTLTQESLKTAIEFNQETYVVEISNVLAASNQPVDEQYIVDIVKLAKDKRYIYPYEAILAVTKAVANSSTPISEKVLITILEQFNSYDLEQGQLLLKVRDILRDKNVVITELTLSVVIKRHPEHILSIWSDMINTKQPIHERFILEAFKIKGDPENSEFFMSLMQAVIDSGQTISEATLIGLLEYSLDQGSDREVIGEMVTKVINSINQTGGQLLVTLVGKNLSGAAVNAINNYFIINGVKCRDHHRYLGHIKFVIANPSVKQNIAPPETPKVATVVTPPTILLNDVNQNPTGSTTSPQPLVVSQGQEKPNNLQGQIHGFKDEFQVKMNVVINEAMDKIRLIKKSRENKKIDKEKELELIKEVSEKEGAELANLFIQEVKDNGKPLAFIYSGNYMQLLSLKVHREYFGRNPKLLKFPKISGGGQALVFNTFMQVVNKAIDDKDIPQDAIEVLVIPTSLCGGSDADPLNRVSFSILKKVFEETQTELIQKGYHIYAMYDEDGKLNLGGGYSENFNKVSNDETDAFFRKSNISRRTLCDLQIGAIQAGHSPLHLEDNHADLCSIEYLSGDCCAQRGDQQVLTIAKTIPEDAIFLTSCNSKHAKSRNTGGINKLKESKPQGLMELALKVYDETKKTNKKIGLLLFPTVDAPILGQQQHLSVAEIQEGLREVYKKSLGGKTIWVLRDTAQQDEEHPVPLLTGTGPGFSPALTQRNQKFEGLTPQAYINEYFRVIEGRFNEKLHSDLRPFEVPLRLAVLQNKPESLKDLKSNLATLEKSYLVGDRRKEECQQLLKIDIKKTLSASVKGLFFSNDNKPKGDPKEPPKRPEGAPPTPQVGEDRRNRR